jgi:soluble lytic murein transglycosylase-like protein
MREGIRRVAALALFAAAVACGHANAADRQAYEPGLRDALLDAISSGSSFQDRFAAQVWLLDMSNRLEKRMPDAKERLEFLHALHRESTRAGLPPELVLSVIDVESRFDRYAISRSGALGYMQVMPFWFKEIEHGEGEHLFNRDTNLRYGCTILSYYMRMENRNLYRALGRYNGSLGKLEYPNLVLGALKKRWYRS